MAASPHISALEILKHTPRSNCGRCGVPNCMAFAALAAAGQKKADDCPFLDPAMRERLAARSAPGRAREEGRPEDLLGRIKVMARDLEFEAVAARCGGWVADGRIALRCLGRVFEVDREGGLHAECHINNWVHVSVLQYLVMGRGADPVGEWITFRELKGPQAWQLYFAHKCEKSLREMNLQYPQLFWDIVGLFGRPLAPGAVPGQDVIVMAALPKVPIVIARSPAEGPFEAHLSLFFDRTVRDNLQVEGAYLLAQGITEMFKRIIERHAGPGP